MKRAAALPWLVLVVVVLVAACSGMAPTQAPTGAPTPIPSAGATGTPSGPPPETGSPTPTGQPSPPPGGVTTAAQAAALVLASDERFINIGPTHPEMFGQCCWYESVPAAAGGYHVTVVIGWGDCMAGCIDEHRWQFAVDAAGAISLLGEEGSEGVPAPEPGDGPATATISLLAGPTCPVETNPPDPACAPRPVAGAEVVIRDPVGTELDRRQSNADGEVRLQVPPGAYVVEALPFEGMMGTPEPVAFSVGPGGEMMLQLDYDTGIR